MSGNAGTATLRLATYNLHGGIGRDGRFDVRRVHAAVRALRADVLALQELSGRRVGDGDLLDSLAADMGMHAVRGATRRDDHGAFGNALLLAVAPESTRRHDISAAHREPRGVLQVDVELAGMPLRLLATHLGLRVGERHRQALALADLAADDHPTALLGDFNEWLPRVLARTLAPLRRRFPLEFAARGFPAWRPLLPLDRIFYRGPYRRARVVTIAAPVTRHASDHLPLVVEIELPPCGRSGGA